MIIFHTSRKKISFYVSPAHTATSGTPALESAAWEGGRLLAGTGTDKVLYYVTDHLGSVRTIKDGSGTIRQRFDYYPFGTVSRVYTSSSSTDYSLKRYRFGGKEIAGAALTELGGTGAAPAAPYLDFGARLYSPRTATWLSVDPMAEKYYGIGPHVYCAASPMNLVDPEGERPIYSIFGYLLGTDDNGLQGDAIIMEESNFSQGMDPELANTFDLGIGGLFNQDAKNRFTESFTSLNTRPDWDGYITLAEANEWYRSGQGRPLFADLSQLDFSGLASLGDKFVDTKKVIPLFLASNSLNEGLVYGSVTLKRYPNHSVRAYADYYDFDMKTWWNPFNWKRNYETIIGHMVAGKGQGYEINLYGSKQLKPLYPWLK